jgi:hypothetical protein
MGTGSGGGISVKKKKQVLRGGLDPNPPGSPDLQETAVAALVAAKNRLRGTTSSGPQHPKVCSEYWLQQAVLGGVSAHVPDAKCSCDNCVGKNHHGWPRPCTGLVESRTDKKIRRWVAWECHFEAKVPADDANAGTPGILTEKQAMDEGFTVIKKGHREPTLYESTPSLLVAGCRCCGGLRKKGLNYCLRCWMVIRRELRRQDCNLRTFEEFLKKLRKDHGDDDLAHLIVTERRQDVRIHKDY